MQILCSPPLHPNNCSSVLSPKVFAPEQAPAQETGALSGGPSLVCIKPTPEGVTKHRNCLLGFFSRFFSGFFTMLGYLLLGSYTRKKRETSG